MIKLTELTKLADKQKWQHRFMRDYDGETVEDSDNLYGPNVRFFLAVSEGKELGFIRINDKSSHFKSVYEGPVWNLTDAYVKPPYRKQGVLREMISKAVETLNVKMLYIETERFESNSAYYATLGFSFYWTVQMGQMSWAFVDSFVEIAEKIQNRN